MLRRKLLTRIGLLIAAFVCGAVVAIWFLQDALSEVDRTNRDAAVLVNGVQNIAGAVTRIQAAREAAHDGAPATTDAASMLADGLAQISSHRIAGTPDSAATSAFEQVRDLAPDFFRLNADPATMHSDRALALSVQIQTAVQNLSSELREYVAAEQQGLARYFRALVLGLTLAALLMVNVAIVVLLRTAQVVLKPVAALVEGSRELATEHFEHRVQVDLQDEFGELAHAYNHLAGQLQANEERKTETLRQLAVTLNHDLNNAMAVIELQLGLIDRQAGGNPILMRHLNDIRTNLARMTGTVASLKNIRRVVLTDYGPGQKMVDLERSTAPAEHAA